MSLKYKGYNLNCKFSLSGTVLNFKTQLSLKDISTDKTRLGVQDLGCKTWGARLGKQDLWILTNAQGCKAPAFLG